MVESLVPQPKPPVQVHRRRSSLACIISLGFVVSIFHATKNISAGSLYLSNVRTDSDVTTRAIPTASVATDLSEVLPEDIDYSLNGILSQKPASFFHALQAKIDNQNQQERCRRFGFPMQAPPAASPITLPRRIFYGALIAEEPWDLIDIVAKESYGIFHAMVFVESNRTQTFQYRPLKHLEDEPMLREKFGIQNVQVRQFINEDQSIVDLTRENLQRQEILRGWKEMGMQPGDVGYLADLDETWSRDFFRAVLHCPYIKEFDYNLHKCDNCIAKLCGSAKVFEASPQCITKDRHWLKTGAVMGACLEEIGDETLHPRARRDHSLLRLPGYSHTCGPGGPWNKEIPDNKFPLFSGSDFRTLSGGRAVTTNVSTAKFTTHSSFHFHNFFANFTKTRFKYQTYLHAKPTAMTDRLEDIHEDLRFMIRCLNGETDGIVQPKFMLVHPEWQRYKRIVGGLERALPPLPIYFMDKEYVGQKHGAAQHLARRDELLRQQNLKWTSNQSRQDAIEQEQRETRRIVEAKLEQVALLGQS